MSPKRVGAAVDAQWWDSGGAWPGTVHHTVTDTWCNVL